MQFHGKVSGKKEGRVAAATQVTSSLFPQRLLPRMPPKRAEFPGLQRFEHPQGLFHASPHRQVVHQLVLQDAVGIDDEKTAQRYPFFFVEDAVAFCNFLFKVGEERII